MANKLCAHLRHAFLAILCVLMPPIASAQTPKNVQTDANGNSAPTISDAQHAQNIKQNRQSETRRMRMTHISAEDETGNAAQNADRVGLSENGQKTAVPTEPFVLQPSKTASPAHATAYLHDLEHFAKESFEKRQYDNVLGIYREYETQMRNAGYDALQIDLLHNQMLAALKAGKLGYAIAYLQQIEIIAPSKENRNKLAALRSLVEYGISQNNPDAVFVRGQADNFQTWQRVSHFSQPQIYAIVLVIWAALFAFLGMGYAAQFITKQNPKKVILTIIPLWIILLVVFAVIITEHRTAKNFRYAILLDTASLSADISPNPKRVGEQGFAEGQIVAVLSQNEKWSYIKRADGVTAWVSNNDIYRLRSVDQATMNSGIKAYRAARNETVDPIDW